MFCVQNARSTIFAGMSFPLYKHTVASNQLNTAQEVPPVQAMLTGSSRLRTRTMGGSYVTEFEPLCSGITGEHVDVLSEQSTSFSPETDKSTVLEKLLVAPPSVCTD